jgi:hypothetical protein
MVGVLVDHDPIAGPVPAGHDVVVEGGYVPVEGIEPETLRTASGQNEYVLRAEAAGEVPVCPRLIEVIMRVVRTAVMPDPLVVFGVNVGKLRVTFLVRRNVVLGCSLAWRSDAGCRDRGSRGFGSFGGSRTASRYVSAARSRGTAATVWFSFFLGKGS